MGRATAGRSWRPTAGWRSPARRRHADAGLDNQLAFLDAALDYVARNTPRDTETAYLEAVVTTWHNTDEPETVVLRSVERDVGDDDRVTPPAAPRRRPGASTSCSGGP